jgi:hypothetical protein
MYVNCLIYIRVFFNLFKITRTEKSEFRTSEFILKSNSLYLLYFHLPSGKHMYSKACIQMWSHYITRFHFLRNTDLKENSMYIIITVKLSVKNCDNMFSVTSPHHQANVSIVSLGYFFFPLLSCLCCGIQTSCGTHLASYSVGPQDFSLGISQPGNEVDHSPPSTAKVKRAWWYSSIPSNIFYV